MRNKSVVTAKQRKRQTKTRVQQLQCSGQLST